MNIYEPVAESSPYILPCPSRLSLIVACCCLTCKVDSSDTSHLLGPTHVSFFKHRGTQLAVE